MTTTFGELTTPRYALCVFVTSIVIITGRTTLKVLHVGNNKFDEDGILMILEECQHNHLLIELSVERGRLSVKGEELTIK